MGRDLVWSVAWELERDGSWTWSMDEMRIGRLVSDDAGLA